MDSDDSDDEKEPAVKHSQKVPKTQEFVDIDPSTSLLVPAVKNTQKAPKLRDEDPQNTCPGSMHKELAKPAKKLPAACCTHILTSGVRKSKQWRLKTSDETGKFCKYHQK